jgi:hypothetical protein
MDDLWPEIEWSLTWWVAHRVERVHDAKIVGIGFQVGGHADGAHVRIGAGGGKW